MVAAKGHPLRCEVGYRLEKSADFGESQHGFSDRTPQTILSLLYAPFLRGGGSLESWLSRPGICKRQLNEPALQQRRRANFGLPASGR